MVRSVWGYYTTTVTLNAKLQRFNLFICTLLIKGVKSKRLIPCPLPYVPLAIQRHCLRQQPDPEDNTSTTGMGPMS